MNCLACGTPVGYERYCPKCGCDLEVQKKAIALSNRYYNMGLEKAQIRDLSGAITCLKQSLKLNKLNINARNLLGLVCFETGEVVAALSEWVISKNIMPTQNPAVEYIERLQKNANKLDNINNSIKKYNLSLAYCKRGDEDMAKMQLRKVLSVNPKLIKGYHLLAFLYMKEEAYEKARKLLKTAARIDKTNTTTLRFLKEIDEQTGRMTTLEPRFRAKERTRVDRDGGRVYQSGNDTIIQPPEYRERTVTHTLINLIIGLLVGAAALWFLIVPAKTQKINQEANRKVIAYSEKAAAQAAELEKMKTSIDASKESVDTAKSKIEEANTKTTSYENLMKAYTAYIDENYDVAANALESVDAGMLSVEGKSLYDTVFAAVGDRLMSRYVSAGIQAYESGDYAKAQEQLEKAYGYDSRNYEVMFYLAQSYQQSKDKEKANEWYQKIIDTFPGTSYASDAKDYLLANGGTVSGNADTSSGEADTSSGEGDTSSGEGDASEYSDGDAGYDTGNGENTGYDEYSEE